MPHADSSLPASPESPFSRDRLVAEGSVENLRRAAAVFLRRVQRPACLSERGRGRFCSGANGAPFPFSTLGLNCLGFAGAGKTLSFFVPLINGFQFCDSKGTARCSAWVGPHRLPILVRRGKRHLRLGDGEVRFPFLRLALIPVFGWHSTHFHNSIARTIGGGV